MEPSGQYAIGQLCTRIFCDRVEFCKSFVCSTPLGQGTPNEIPISTGGGDLSSQLTVTSAACATATTRNKTPGSKRFRMTILPERKCLLRRLRRSAASASASAATRAASASAEGFHQRKGIMRQLIG